MPVLASDFFMRLARALQRPHKIASTPNSIEGLDSVLNPSLVEQALEQAGVATLRKRRLPLAMMLWCVIAMAFFRRMSAWDVVSRITTMLPGQRPLVAPSAVAQARQRLDTSVSGRCVGVELQRLIQAAKVLHLSACLGPALCFAAAIRRADLPSGHQAQIVEVSDQK